MIRSDKDKKKDLRSNYLYNSRKLLISETQTISGQSPRIVSYDYDADGLRTNLDYPSGVAMENQWTALGQLDTVSADGPPPLASYSYDKAGRPDLLEHEHDRRLVGRVDCPAGSPVRGEFAMRGQIHQNGVTQARQYDAASQLLNITHTHNGVIQSGHGYGYDNTGRRTSETFLNGGTPARTYSYDAASQVTAADYGAGQADSFNYDAMGNRTSATIASQGGGTFNYGAATTANQYTSITGRSAITHDANGNQLLNGAGAAFTWDSENRLLTVTPVSPSLGDKAHVHSYDGLHRRVTRTTREWTSSGWTNLETTYFIYDGWNVIEEWTSTFSPATTATLTRRLTWGQDLAGSPSLQGAGGVGGLLMVEEITSTTNEAYHFHYDGNGNVTEITDHLGASVATYRYDAFGNTLVAAGTYAATNRYRFSTKPLDHEVTTAPLYYYGYRYLDPVTGRWPSRDPIEERGGVNLYGFVGNGPINYSDRLGLCRWCDPDTHWSEKPPGIILRGMFPILFVGIEPEEIVERQFQYWEGGNEVWEVLSEDYTESSGKTNWLEVAKDPGGGRCCVKLMEQEHIFKGALVRRAKQFRLYHVTLAYRKSDEDFASDLIGRATAVLPDFVSIPIDLAAEINANGKAGSLREVSRTLFATTHVPVGAPERRYRHIRSEKPQTVAEFEVGSSCDQVEFVGHLLHWETSLALSDRFPQYDNQR